VHKCSQAASSLIADARNDREGFCGCVKPIDEVSNHLVDHEILIFS